MAFWVGGSHHFAVCSTRVAVGVAVEATPLRKENLDESKGGRIVTTSGIQIVFIESRNEIVTQCMPLCLIHVQPHVVRNGHDTHDRDPHVVALRIISPREAPIVVKISHGLWPSATYVCVEIERAHVRVKPRFELAKANVIIVNGVLVR